MGTIGLIAGGGRFPLLFAESARHAGHRVVAVAHRNETDPSLAEKVDAITWVKLGQIGHILEALRAGGATQTVMLGAITKRRFFADAMFPAMQAFSEEEGCRSRTRPRSSPTGSRRRASSAATGLPTRSSRTRATAWSWRAASGGSTSARR